ncbi:MAG: hypothetical protein HYY64_01810 [Candidatus Rokubacteria bacterium]|nr:hypothetical protein [Candidatus Rokubacteria bacterium]
MTGPYRFILEYDPRLVEEATLLALRGAEEETAFRRERDGLYEIADPEAREAAFRAFHAAWFERLGLGRPIGWALKERGLILRAADRCLLAYAPSAREEGAELLVAERRRSVAIRLAPVTLLAPERLLAFLRHELLHVADMLDPRFAYEPWLPSAGAGPAHRELLKERYRVLWDAYIDGRLSRLGWAPAGVRAERLGEFKRSFPTLGERAEVEFERFFNATWLRHAELVAFAADPPGGGGCCPLCRFPTHAFEPEPDLLPPAVKERIRSDFPEWEPAAGLCLQCADLYRARSPAVSDTRV